MLKRQSQEAAASGQQRRAHTESIGQLWEAVSQKASFQCLGKLDKDSTSTFQAFREAEKWQGHNELNSDEDKGRVDEER